MTRSHVLSILLLAACSPVAVGGGRGTDEPARVDAPGDTEATDASGSCRGQLLLRDPPLWWSIEPDGGDGSVAVGNDLQSGDLHFYRMNADWKIVLDVRLGDGPEMGRDVLRWGPDYLAVGDHGLWRVDRDGKVRAEERFGEGDLMGLLGVVMDGETPVAHYRGSSGEQMSRFDASLHPVLTGSVPHGGYARLRAMPGGAFLEETLPRTDTWVHLETVDLALLRLGPEVTLGEWSDVAFNFVGDRQSRILFSESAGPSGPSRLHRFLLDGQEAGSLEIPGSGAGLAILPQESGYLVRDPALGLLQGGYRDLPVRAWFVDDDLGNAVPIGTLGLAKRVAMVVPTGEGWRTIVWRSPDGYHDELWAFEGADCSW